MKKNILLCLFLQTGLFSQSSMAQDVPTVFAQKSTYERLIQTKKEYQEALETGDSAEIAELSYRLAKRYQDLNDVKNTRYYFMQALTIRKAIGSSNDLGKIYQRLAEWHFHRKELRDSENYFRLAIRHYSRSSHLHRQAECYRILGEIHEQRATLSVEKLPPSHRPDYDSAFYYYKYAADVARKYHYPIEISRDYFLIGKLLLQNSNYKGSILYSQKAFELYLKEKDYPSSISTATLLAQNYLHLGEMRNCKKWLNKADSIFASSKSPFRDRIGILNILREYYKVNGDWQNAYAYQEQMHQYILQNQDRNQKSLAEGARLLQESEQREAMLHNQTKELELALSRENQHRQRALNIFIALLFIISLTAGVVYYRLYRRYKVISHQNEDLVKEQSHRIKNNLQSVSDLLTLQLYQLSDTGAIQALEESLARINAMSLVHQRLYEGIPSESIALQTLIPELVKDILRSYHLSHVHTHLRLEDVSLPADKAITVALLLNELTTNSCKHAFINHPAPTLAITCALSEHEVSVTYKDNGPGFTYSASSDTFGLKLISILVKKLKGKSQLSHENGMHFQLSFALVSNKKDLHVLPQ